MWYLEGFDRTTERLVHDVSLPRVDAEVIRRVLKIDDDLPIEPFGFDVPTASAARELASYSERPVAIDPSLWYQVGFCID